MWGVHDTRGKRGRLTGRRQRKSRREGKGDGKTVSGMRDGKQSE